LHRAYVEENTLTFDSPSAADLIGPIDDVAALPSMLARAVDAILEKVRAYLDKDCNGIELSPHLASAWKGRLQVLAKAYGNLQRVRPPHTILLSEISKPFQKIIAGFFRRKGATIIGANHGHFIGQMSLPGIAWHSHAHCDAVICYSQKNADLLEADYRSTSIGRRRPVRFFATATAADFDTMDRIARQFPRRSTVKSVMLIGYPMTDLRYAWSAGDYFAFQLDVELRLADLLRKAGYRVVYKMHPDRRSEATGLLDDHVDEIVVTAFERIWPKADAFVFGNIMTTVFNVAILTDRPVVALDIEGYRWMQHVRSDLAQRVRFVPASFNSRNRVCFDEAAILTGLKDGVCAHDRSYIDQYLLRGRSVPPGVISPKKVGF
jgi:hypothetical protein